MRFAKTAVARSKQPPKMNSSSKLNDQTELTAQTEPISDFPDRSRAATLRAWLADRQTAKQLVPLPLIPTAGQCSADN